jgi:hypothetical protein
MMRLVVLLAALTLSGCAHFGQRCAEWMDTPNTNPIAHAISHRGFGGQMKSPYVWAEPEVYHDCLSWEPIRHGPNDLHSPSSGGK